jgi:recombinational DNA repair protein RecT
MPSSTTKPQPARPNVPTQRQQPTAQPPAAREPDEWNILKSDLDRNRNVYEALLGNLQPATPAQVERFMVLCYQVVWHKPDLLGADRDSLLLAFAEGAAVQLDFSPTAKEAFIEIREGLARFATQYPGLIKLIHRGNDVDFIHVDSVRRGDLFRQVGGSNPHIEHVAAELGHEPADYDDDNSILATYAVIKLKGSSRAVHEVSRRADFLKAKAMSKGPAWKNWLSRMALKLPLRRLANRLPFADEARQMIAVEDAQDRGEAVTLERVRELLGDRPIPTPRLAAAPHDELRGLMDASGPVVRDGSRVVSSESADGRDLETAERQQ